METAPLSPARKRAYMLINWSSAPLWLAMIVAPRSAFTRWVVQAATPLYLGLGVAYDGLLAAGLVQKGEMIDFTDPEAVREALASPDVFLAGWAHYIAFDLFVGRWIWEDALARDRAPRLALLLTWLAGPAGLSLYLVQRRAAG